MNKPAIISSVVGAAVLAVGGVGVAQADKAVDLQVDGQHQTVHTFGSTVGDALGKAGVQVGEHDQVVPSVDAKISDGTQVVVRYGRELTVTIDGTRKTFWTTASTVDEALTQIGLREPNTRLSVSRSTTLGREGLTFSAVTPKSVTLVADGQTRTIDSTTATVQAFLTEQSVKLATADKLSPAATTPLTDGLKVVVQRVTTKKVSEKSKVAHGSTRVTSDSLAKGTTKVTTQGIDGEKTLTYLVTLVDGKQVSKKLLATKVTKQPVTEVTTVGTKVEQPKTPTKSTTTKSTTGSSEGSSSSKPATDSSSSTSTSGLNLARAAMWDRIAQCESSGDWHINTGNGYYGGLQFDSQTWLSSGGGKYASRADLASREQQITIANALYAERGLSPWGCAGAA